MPSNRTDPRMIDGANIPSHLPFENNEINSADRQWRNRDELQPGEDLLVFAQRVFERTNNGFFEWFVPTNRFRYSKSFERMLGYRADELDLSEANISAHIFPEDYNQLVRTLANSARNGLDVDIQLRLYNKNTELRWYRLQLFVYEFNSSGGTKTALGCVTDINDLKIAQQESLYRMQLEKWLTSTVRDLLIDEKPSSIARCLSKLCAQFEIDVALMRDVRNNGSEFSMVDIGYSPGNSKQFNFSHTISRNNLPFDVDSFLAGNAYLVDDIETDRTLTAEMKSKFINNVRSFAAIPIYYHGKLDYFLSLLRYSTKPWSPESLRAAELMGDAIALVAARQRMTEVLNRNEERFQQALEATQDGIWDWDIEQQQFTVTPTFLYMLGYDEDFLPLTEEKLNQLFFAPINIRSFFESNYIFNNATLGRFEVDLPMRHKSGASVWVSIRGKHAKWNDKGEPVRSVGENKNIQLQKYNQQQLLLKARQELQQRLIQSINIQQAKTDLCQLREQLESSRSQLSDCKWLPSALSKLSELCGFSESPDNRISLLESAQFLNADDDASRFDIDRWLDSEVIRLQQLAQRRRVRFDCHYPKSFSQPYHRRDNLLHLALTSLTQLFIDNVRDAVLTLNMIVLKNTEQEAQVQFVWHSDKLIEVLSGLDCSNHPNLKENKSSSLSTPTNQLRKQFQHALDYFVLLNSEINVRNNEDMGMVVSALVPLTEHNAIQFDSLLLHLSPAPDQATEANYETEKYAGADDLLSNKFVLLAEDNIVNQKVAVGMLERKGMQVTVANNGREAVDILMQNDCHYFDLVLMDMDMPVLDGYDATRVIRSDQRLAHLPVIAVTAHTKDEDREKSFAAGVIEHIAKPIKPDILYSVISDVLKQRQQSAAIGN